MIIDIDHTPKYTPKTPKKVPQANTKILKQSTMKPASYLIDNWFDMSLWT